MLEGWRQFASTRVETLRSARRSLLFILMALPAGCATRIDFGSDILWSARHETGDLTEWSTGEGGTADDQPTTTVGVSTDFAHSGRYAAKLTNGATGTYDASRVWRESSFPKDAYYSSWFYLTQAYRTTADWTILQFRAPTAQDPSVIAQLLDVDLRSLPSGDMILSVFDHRAQYLRSPTPDVAMPVPIGRWFQIEAYFRNVADDSGRLTIWLDGQLNYDIQRPMGLSSTVYWSPCSSTQDLVPLDSVLYMDDAAVSLVRLTPTGTF